MPKYVYCSECEKAIIEIHILPEGKSLIQTIAHCVNNSICKGCYDKRLEKKFRDSEMNNPTVHAAMEYYRRGDCSLEHALKTCVVVLVEQYDIMFSESVKSKSREAPSITVEEMLQSYEDGKKNWTSEEYNKKYGEKMNKVEGDSEQCRWCFYKNTELFEKKLPHCQYPDEQHCDENGKCIQRLVIDTEGDLN